MDRVWETREIALTEPLWDNRGRADKDVCEGGGGTLHYRILNVYNFLLTACMFRSHSLFLYSSKLHTQKKLVEPYLSNVSLVYSNIVLKLFIVTIVLKI